ncbi:hypothetical protein HY772_10070 [Candidatus Woesearchaeota archaeon]|nr:hypothetical protein [Candidatus Woesearchaeota archaeon]
MSKKQPPVTGPFDFLTTNVLAPFITGNGSNLLRSCFFSPSDLFHIIPRCDPRTDFFKFEFSKGNNDSGQNPPVRRKKNGFKFWDEKFFPSSSEPSCSRENNKPKCRIGVRYIVTHFPAFEKATPQFGLTVGKEERLYWVRPLRAELSKVGLSDGLFPMEIKTVFMLTFQDGSGGQAGYIDRIHASGKYRRYHLYADGEQEPVEECDEECLTHDLFRTLMGQLLLAEIYPQLYERIRALIRHIEAKPAVQESKDIFPHTNKVTDNVFSFASITLRNRTGFQTENEQRQVCLQ